MASTVFQRRLIETQFAFQEATGHSSAAYRKLHGPLQHQQKQLEVLTDVLHKNERGCIIICGTEATDRSCQSLLRDYCKSHPVVHVLRDEESVCNYLKTLERRKVRELMRVSKTVFRSCANYEFFNLSDGKQEVVETSGDARRLSDNRFHTPFLTLKKAERHFLKFMALVTAGNILSTLEAAYPLSNTRVELRPFTYAVSVGFSELELLSGTVDIEQLESGSDAFELCIDETRDDVDLSPSPEICVISRVFAEVRRNTIVPIIYHVDRSRSKDQSAGYQYMELVHHGLRLAPEFVTVDLHLNDAEIQCIVDAKGSVKIIGDMTCLEEAAEWDDAWWVDTYERAVRLGCDVVRLRRPGVRLEDNFAVQRLRDKVNGLDGSAVPVTAFNTGRHGKTSLVFNPTLTSVRHESLPRMSEPSVTARECTEALSKCFVYDPMNFYIFGASVSYSLSPAMHNAGYELCGLPHTYRTNQTPTLNDLHDLVTDPHFGGVSVTLPFKIEIIALTHSLSRHAKAIGAVNTLIPVRELAADGTIPDELSLLKERNRAGPVKALYGENTDWIGIRACIRRGLSPVNAVRPQSTALVVGAGGMARAAVYALLQLGVRNIFIHNRTLANAERLAEYNQQLVSGPSERRIDRDFKDVRLHVLESREAPWPSAYRQPTIVVSCIPTHSVGDSPAPPKFTMPAQWLKSPTGGVVLEVAYKTLHTPLLEQIRAEVDRGWVAMDGLDLLPEQGFAQFELFTGRRAPRRLMREQVLRQYRDSGVQDTDLIQSRLALIDEQEP
ncbi:hypothetical protein NA57DRAFT_57094 [Rhizodiscina lignyota]|uniref:Quinate repressor protein n=1 Tax=Rhizodiscina lignyota TaxID=1504668 RepID=A0A9P4IBV6_9PEZI|nr:hypothetical protein NA57DRAFT_57094 [Rhizodiscina lignyota]